jgi:hypothetical protein
MELVISLLFSVLKILMGSWDYQAFGLYVKRCTSFVYFGFQRHCNLILNSVDQPYLARIRMIKCVGYHCFVVHSNDFFP